MTAAPVWFGDSDRPLFGWFEVPDDGRARAGVVICPPLAVEYASSQPALQRLSARLVAEGLAVLRFDYDGTGDSSGADEDHCRVGSWTSSIRRAIECVVRSGCDRVALVGLRMGANLAVAELLAGGGVDAALLWDPCDSGRMFMRQQSMLRRTIERGEILDDGSVEGPGIVLMPETVAELNALVLSGEGAIADQVLVLSRSTRPLRKASRQQLDGPNVEWQEIEGQEWLVDVEPARAVVPAATLDLIVKWLVGVTDGTDVPITVPESCSGTVGHTDDGRAIVERPLWLGPHGLFGMETVPDGYRRGESPVALFVNAGVIDHVGPSRTWVTLARALARHGMRSVRFDLNGIGASPLRPGSEDPSMRTIEAHRDVADAQKAVSGHDPSDVVFVGLCSGGFHSSEAALSTGARGVVMINPSFRLPLGEASTDHDSPVAVGGLHPNQATRDWVTKVPGRAAMWGLVRRSPESLWVLINRLAIDHPPAETLARLAAAGVDVLVACDDYDAWVIQRGGRRALQRNGRRGRVRVEIIEGMDHTLFCREPRGPTVTLACDFITEKFAPATD
jgi:alpha-beta hydrolase superfamily lysophospholipase